MTLSSYSKMTIDVTPLIDLHVVEYVDSDHEKIDFTTDFISIAKQVRDRIVEDPNYPKNLEEIAKAFLINYVPNATDRPDFADIVDKLCSVIQASKLIFH